MALAVTTRAVRSATAGVFGCAMLTRSLSSGSTGGSSGSSGSGGGGAGGGSSSGGGGGSGGSKKSSSSGKETRLHSTDIAFKPNSAGWGYTPQYASNFNAIFSSSKPDARDDDAGADATPDGGDSDQGVSQIQAVAAHLHVRYGLDAATIENDDTLRELLSAHEAGN